MAKLAKFLQGVAGAAGGAGLNIEDVFSTYLYTGTASAQTITNNIDLSGEGGITWIKNRENSSADHSIYTTDIGNDKLLATNKNDALNTVSNSLSFTSSGFSLSATNIGYWNTNKSGEDYVSWTFRKAPKFFTCLTYTGDGTAGRTISHNLGSTPGCIIIKGTSSNYEWSVYHRGMDSTAPEDYSMWLNGTYARFDNTGYWNDTAPTSTQFTLGNNGNVNASGQTYVAYLFAHDTASDGLIQCGSYTGNGSTTGPVIDLGFEPQWVMIKNTSGAGDWTIFDSLRGVATGGVDPRLHPNTTQVESASADIIDFNSTGFQLTNVFGDYNASGDTYIYMAIRNPYIPTITYDTDLEFAGGTAPTSPAIGETDVITISTRDGGTTYQAVQAIDGAK